MSFDTHYQTSDRNYWEGRLDSPTASSIFQFIKLLDITKPIPLADHLPAFALLGFCCDEGIRRNLGRIGAAEGPYALRNVLAKLPVHRADLQLFDAGNIICHDHNLEEAQAALGEAVYALLDRNYTPILIGGGHEMAWGHYQGIAKKTREANLGIINFDAHYDMRQTQEAGRGSSGTPFMQIAHAHENAKLRFDYNCIGIQPYGNTRQLMLTAERHQVKTITAEEVMSEPGKVAPFIKRVVDDNEHVYLTLCLDVFAASFAPGVSATQAFGLTPFSILPAIRQLAASGKVVSYDIAELSPKYDIDSRTAKLAANFIYEILHHHTITK